MGKIAIILFLITSIRLLGQSAEEYDTIKSILNDIRNTDQEYRYKVMEKTEQYGFNSLEVKKLWDTISIIDSINLIKTENILLKYGWLGFDKIGKSANQTLFLVIQHSRIEKKIAFLPLLRKSTKEGNSSPTSLAYMEDVVSLYYNKYQIFGSQFKNNSDGKRILEKVYNPADLDKRRISMGLIPIKEYCDKLGIIYEK